MKNRWPSLNAVFAVSLAALIGLLIVGSAVAQDDDNATQTRTREQVRQQEQDSQGDMVRERIRERIMNEDGLQEREREQLRKHLRECEQLKVSNEMTAAMFDENTPLNRQLRVQERVLAMVREGLPAEPVMRKLQEGRRKGVNEERLEQVCERMEAHVRTANRFMKRLNGDGIKGENPDAEQRQTREMAQYMWRGLKEEDMERLRERARLRLRDGSCTTEEFTAATETATRLHEMRVERKRAVGLAGDALQNGYSAREMRQLRWMLMTAHMGGGPKDEVLETLEQGLRNRHQFTHMIQQMQHRGWMGPADEHGGRGGHSLDDKGGNGPGGGQGGNDDRGGNGGGGSNDNGGGGSNGKG